MCNVMGKPEGGSEGWRTLIGFRRVLILKKSVSYMNYFLVRVHALPNLINDQEVLTRSLMHEPIWLVDSQS